MTAEKGHDGEPVEEPGEAPESDSDAAEQSAASDPSVSPAVDEDAPEASDGLTVDDILATEQSDEAAVAEASEQDRDLLLDLKRITAEYANYRRRTEAERVTTIQRAKGEVATKLLPVLDDLDRAAQHGDLEEGSVLAVIAEKLRGVTERMGVEKFGVVGEPFDPQQHQAIFQQPTPGAEQPTILEVVEAGYRLGEVELRPAKVVVAVPAE